MKNKRFVTKVFAAAFVFASLFITSCASSGNGEKAKLVEEDSRLFWRIDGTDKNGNPSSIYIQGTFHLADEQSYPISEQVVSAFKNADRVYGELASDDWPAVQNKVVTLMTQSYKEGRDILDYLTEEEQAKLITLFQGEKNLEPYKAYEPWVINSSVTAAIYLVTGLDAQSGIDNWLESTNLEMGRKTLGLDDLQTQLNLVRYGDYNTQLAFLKGTLSEYPFVDTIDQLVQMYQAYLEDDRAGLEKLLNGDTEDDLETIPVSIYEKYYKDMILNRNTKWAKTFKKLLKEGGTTFVFAGSAHFLGPDSVFEIMKSQGVLDF